MPTATIGSGKDYATLTAWWTAIKASATDTYTAQLEDDITDSAALTGATNNKTLVIQSDGTRRKITNNDVTHTILVNDIDIVSFTIQDVEIDNAGYNRRGIQVASIGGPVNIKRCIVHDTGTEEGIGGTVQGSDTAQTYTFENCLIYDCAEGINFAKVVANTFNITNCGILDCSTYGVTFSNTVGVTHNIQNCYVMNSTTSDIRTGYTNPTVNVTYSVSSDTSATNGHDSTTGSVISKSSYTSYFSDYDNDDFTLKDDDNTLWGLNGDAGTTPADTIDGLTRYVDDVGPYESWNKSTVGSGGDYATLTAWETAIQASASGGYEAELIGDITDNLIMFTITNAKNIWIHGDTTGASKRKITSAASGAHVLRFGDADITYVLIEDLEIDGTGQAASNNGVYVSLGDPTFIMRRCNIHNAAQDGIRFVDGCNTSATLENVISHNNGAHGFYSQDTGGTNTLKNCGFFKNTSRGVYIPDNAGLTMNMYNCIAMGNGADDFEDAFTNPTVNCISCVSEDTTADSANFDDVTNSIANESTSGPFADYTNNDFHLTNTAANLWSITVNSANTPAEDFDSVTRSADDTGPYEYVAAGGGGLTSGTLALLGAGV